MDIRAAYEKFADSRAKYVGCEFSIDGLSITYQVDGHPVPSKSFYSTVDPPCSMVDAAEAIGKEVLSDVKAA